MLILAEVGRLEAAAEGIALGTELCVVVFVFEEDSAAGGKLVAVRLFVEVVSTAILEVDLADERLDILAVAAATLAG